MPLKESCRKLAEGLHSPEEFFSICSGNGGEIRRMNWCIWLNLNQFCRNSFLRRPTDSRSQEGTGKPELVYRDVPANPRKNRPRGEGKKGEIA